MKGWNANPFAFQLIKVGVMDKIRSSFLIYRVLVSLFLSIIMVGSQRKENVLILSGFCHEVAEFLPFLVEIIGYHTL